MPFTPGTPRPAGAGRKPGTQNAATREAQRIAEEMGVDPLRVLLQLAAADVQGLGLTPYVDGRGQQRNPSVPLDVRVQAAIAAAKHLYPTIKSVDHAVSVGPLDQFMSMTVEERTMRLQHLNAVLADDDEANSSPSEPDMDEQSAHFDIN